MKDKISTLSEVKGSQYNGNTHTSPFLNAELLGEQGLVPNALEILLVAKEKGCISPQQIGTLIPVEILQDGNRLRATMRWITQLLGVINVRIKIDGVRSEKTKSYSPANSTGLSVDASVGPSNDDLQKMERGEDAKINGEENKLDDSEDEFAPKFILDKDTGITNSYYHTVKDHAFLKYQDLLELARRWRMNSDYEARNTIVVHNLRLSMKIARHYMGQGLDYDDLVQEGNIGLLIAAEKFDPDKGFQFTTYASWWVRQRMVRAIKNFKDVIRVPVHATEALNKIHKIRCELEMELQREPTLEEVAARAGEDPVEVKKILHQLKVPVVSLEELIYSNSSEDSDAIIGDRVADNGFPSAVTALKAKEDLKRASLVIQTLLTIIKTLSVSDKAKTAFCMYYGLDGHPEGATLESIAQNSGFRVSRERIRQLNADVWEALTEYGVPMNDGKLVAALQRVHDLENIVGIEADLSPLTEAIAPNQVLSVFNDAKWGD